jgi:hypothetical protein
MDISKRKEEFGFAYIQAVASVAGFSICRPHVDNDSIDVQFMSNFKNEWNRSPRIEAQLKCTAQDVILEEFIHFPLKIKNYNDLRDPNTFVPRILICVVLPEDDPLSWINHSEESLCMMKCGYWVSLLDCPPKENSQTVTIHIPRSQTFNVYALQNLMDNVGRSLVKV